MTELQQSLMLHAGRHPGKSDRELTEELLGKGVHPSRVNQEARLLESRGKLQRRLRADGRIGNYPVRGGLFRKVLRLISG